MSGETRETALSLYDTEVEFATLDEITQAARASLDPATWDFLEGGAGSEQTLRDNRSAFGRWSIRPTVMSGIAEPHTVSTFLGRPLAMPVLTAPFGADALFHPDGHLAVARANARFGIASIVPEASSHSLADVAAAAPEAALVMQLHPVDPVDNFRAVASRARELGYRALCITVDCPRAGWRERNMANRFNPDLDVVAGNYPVGGAINVAEVFAPRGRGLWSWQRLQDALSAIELPWMAKGILTAADARAAVDAGAFAVVVSTHGGRQLDGAPGALDQLREVADAVAGRVTVIADSGVRRGTDVIKAIALGADLVLVGRLAAYGLAADGEAGVLRVLELLREEMQVNMALAGRPDVASLDRTLLQRRPRAEV
jgi:isopentenyl diphosphate isomerase/L-lactate dehydrogenase-like FMN-dependent dehydrogenase